jgi:hypothetical protein
MPRGVNRYDDARLQGRLWTPEQERSSLWAWFAADDPRTLTVDGSGNVSDWLDKSGNARHLTQATSGLRPIYSTNIFGPKPAVWGGSGGIKRRLATTVTPTLAQPFTVWMLLKNNAGLDNFSHAFEGENTSSGSRAILCLRRSDAGDDPTLYAGTAMASIGADLIANTVYLLGGVYNGASSIGIYNAADTGALNPGTDGIIGGIMFCTASGTECDAYFAEWLVISRAMSAAERRRMEGYLAWKWDVRGNLPGSHPFKNRPPLTGD